MADKTIRLGIYKGERNEYSVEVILRSPKRRIAIVKVLSVITENPDNPMPIGAKVTVPLRKVSDAH